jgi:hypothetical protein
MRYLSLSCLLLMAMFSALACSSRLPAERAAPASATTEDVPGTPARAEPVADTAKTEIDRWRESVLAAVADYRSYTKVADYPLWAPEMCAAPRPSVQFMSDATAGRAHGQKLYFLWVKDLAAYNPPRASMTEETPQGAGQIIVKETFHAIEGEGSIEANGKKYKAGERGPLFVMMRFDDKREGTDRGWIYATLTEDGKEVTSAGRTESCMGCHDDAGDDRVFGVRADKNDGK